MALNFLTLRDWLLQSEPEVRWRIEGWQPVESRVILSAQFKAGKTTARDNLVRSLVDGDPWLGAYRVEPITGKVAIFDTEMSRFQLRRWLRDQRVVNDDRVIVEPLRGRAGEFDILNRDIRAEWAERLREAGVTYLILDCLRPVLDALGLDEHKEAGKFLQAFDTLLAKAQIPDSLIVHHMGHAGERSRGDSRFRDWPDVEWRIVRQNEDPASPRYLTAYGRDVDVPKTVLTYDDATRRLTVGDVVGPDTRTEAALAAVLLALDAAGAQLSQRKIVEIVEALEGHPHTRNAIRSAIESGISNGSILVTEPAARGGSRLHRRAPSAPVRGSAPSLRRRSAPEECASAPPSIEAAHSAHSAEAFTNTISAPSAHAEDDDAGRL
jgi:hypothetical protein